MNFVVQEARPNDSQAIADYAGRVANESDSLTYGTSETPVRDTSSIASIIERQALGDGFALPAFEQRSKAGVARFAVPVPYGEQRGHRPRRTAQSPLWSPNTNGR